MPVSVMSVTYPLHLREKNKRVCKMSSDKLINKIAAALEEMLYRLKWDRDFAELYGTTRAKSMAEDVLKEYEQYKRGG